MRIKKDNEQVPIIKYFYILGTLIQLKIFGENAQIAINESIKRLLEIDDKMSVFKEDSEVLKINRNAGGHYQGVSEDTYFVVETSLKYSNMSQGAFDPTIRPLVDVWGFGRENQKVPNKNEIKEAISTCAYVMGLEKGYELIESLDGIDAIFITENKKVFTTSDIKNNFKLVNKDFNHVNL